MKYFFFFIFSSFLLSSCVSIEKRRYMDGYYIDWHSNKEIVQSVERKEPLKEIAKESELEIISLSASNDSSAAINLIKPAQISRLSIVSDTLPHKKHDKKHDAPMKDDQRRDVGDREPKINPLGIIGFVFSILALSMVPFVTYAAYIPAIIAIIFSAIGLVKSEYKGKGYAVAGFVISTLVIFILSFYLLEL